MPKKIISKIAAHAESVRIILVEETLPDTLSKVKNAGNTVADGVNKVSKSATKTFSSVKDNAATVVTTGIKQVSEVEWKKEFEKFKALDIPLVSKLRPIDWSAEHVKFWEEDKAVAEAAETPKDKWDTEPEPHELVSGVTGNKTVKQPKPVDKEEEIPLEKNEDGDVSIEIDEVVYTSVSEPKTGKTVHIADLLDADAKAALLATVSEANNDSLEKDEDKLSLDDSKEKNSVPAPKKTVKATSKDPVVTVLGSGEGEVEPLGVAYKRLVRKVAKQAEKNPDVKLYLSGKTFGIGARGTTEKIDGNDVSVFNAKDIKKLLAKIS